MVFGKSSKRTVLILPSGFMEKVESVSGQEGEIADGLTEFILLHELAHIKNRDVVFTSWLHCFLRAFRYVVVFLFPCLVVDILLLPNDHASMMSIMVLIVSYSVLLMLANSFARFRELLADARASLCIERPLLSKLLEAREEESISPFEAVVIMWTVLSGFRPADRSFTKTSSLKTAVRALLGAFYAVQMYIERAFRVFAPGAVQEIRSRIAALKSQKYVGAQASLPTFGTAFLNGLVGTLAFIFSLLLGIVLDPLGRLLGTLWQTGRSGNILMLWAGWSALFYVSYMFSLPLRNSTLIGGNMRSYHKGLAARYFVAALAGILLFAMLVIVVSDSRGQASAYIGAAVIPLGFYSMAFLLSCVFSVLLFLADNLTQLYRRKEALFFFIFLPGWLCVLGLFLILAWRIGWFITLLGIVIGMIVSMLLLGIFPLQGHPMDRWVKLSPFVFRKLFDEWLFEKYTLGTVNFYLIAIYGVPSVSAILFLSQFCGQDDSLSSGSSVKRLLYLALLITLFGLCLAYYFAKRYASRLLTAKLRIGHLLSESLRVLDATPPAEDREKMRRVLSFAESRKGGFSWTRGKRNVCMDTTWAGLACLSALGLEPAYKSEHIKWILQCRNRDGGFGVLPGLSSRLSATFYALSSLSTLDSLETVDSERHAVWIKKWRTQEGGFHGPFSGWESLTDTYFAVGSLKLLGKVESIEHEHCATWALNDWRKGTLTHERTYYLVNILVWLGQLSQERAAEIERKYLLPYAPVMAHLRIDKYPGLVFYYLSCTAALGDITSIERNTGQFTNRVQIAFRSFVRNSAEKLITDDFRR
jgi:hypothetical protein